MGDTTELSTLKLQIGTGRSSEIKDLRTDFEFVCAENPDYTPIGKVKELQKSSFLDEDGDDPYIPQQMKMQSGTLKVPIACQGKRGTCKGKLKTLVKWLLGRGGVPLDENGILLYYAFIDEGFGKVTLQEVTDVEYNYQGEYELLEANLVFYIPDPFCNYTFDGGTFSKV